MRSPIITYVVSPRARTVPLSSHRIPGMILESSLGMNFETHTFLARPLTNSKLAIVVLLFAIVNRSLLLLLTSLSSSEPAFLVPPYLQSTNRWPHRSLLYVYHSPFLCLNSLKLSILSRCGVVVALLLFKSRRPGVQVPVPAALLICFLTLLPNLLLVAEGTCRLFHRSRENSCTTLF